jgi:hypothetical protein
LPSKKRSYETTFFQGRNHVDGKDVNELDNYEGLPTEYVGTSNTPIGKR